MTNTTAPVTHFTAWLVNDLSALDTDRMDSTVIEDELIGSENDDEWASTGPVAFHAVTTVDAKSGDIEDATKEARHLMEVAGWRIAGDWDVVDNAYIVTVERA